MQKTTRILALLLAVALTVTQLPVMALSTGAGQGGEIIAFDTLPEETANQTVTLGASLEDLNLPNTLIATVRVVAEADTEASEPDNDPVQDSGKPQQEEPSEPVADAGNEGEGKPEPDEGQPEPEAGSEQPDKPEQAPAEPETMEMNIPIPVKWVSSPDYDGEKASTYIFTVQIEGFAVSAAPPSITVTVGEITGTVTDFEELPDEIRWQNTAEPTFPETVRGTVEGEAVQIPVTWETEQDYDENSPERGLYVFDAVPGEDYTLAGGAIAPRITVYIPETVSRFAPSRMGGGGTAASPLEITTAAQLAEIAELVNAGRLESFLLNEASEKVSLKLMNDLDLSAYGQGYNGGKGWVPIGTGDNPFKGHFDGNGNTIAGLYINDKSLRDAGLFGNIDSGTVENLLLADAYVQGYCMVGGIAGTISNATIQRCGVEGILHGTAVGSANVGGVVGNVSDARIENCYSSGSVSGNYYNIGGIVGYLAYPNPLVRNCYSLATVTGDRYVGGIVGTPYYSSASPFAEDCVALNPSVSGNGNTGRVAGNSYDGNLAGNIAFSGMTGGGDSKTTDGKDGADITAATIKADGTIGNRFTEDNCWTVAPGKLPGLFGETVEMPEYITGGTDSNFPGEGTEESPYMISTAAQLAQLAGLVNTTTTNVQYGGEHIYYKLIGDLDLSGYGASNTGFNGGKGWVPIGSTDTLPFKGIFDGGGNTITGLYLNDPALSYAGLFGYVSGGTVENLALQAVNINSGSKLEADAAAGGVAACIAGRGSVEKCSVSGQINSYWQVGGVVGKALEDGTTVKHCLVSASVRGHQEVGGVVGQAEFATIQSCYSTGEISNGIFPDLGLNAGGIAASNMGGTIKDCAALNPKISASKYAGRIVGSYYKDTVLTDNVAFDGILDRTNNEMPANDNSSGLDGAATTADALQSASGFPLAFTTDPWTYTPGKLPGLFGKTVEMPAHITNKLTSFFGGGDGTSAETAYQISTAAQLAKLAVLVNDTANNEKYGGTGVYYELIADLDISGYNASNELFNGGTGWVPIGKTGASASFKGSFNGGNKTIKGLYINNDLGYAGLFGYVTDGGTISNLALTEVNITSSNDNIAGIVGCAYSVVVDNCSVSGMVSGKGNVGGVVGQAVNNTSIRNCYATGTVQGSSIKVGGIVGAQLGSELYGCIATNKVNGGNPVGGIVGSLEGANGKVQNCAALNPSITSTGSVTGRRIIGVHMSGSMFNNYAFSGMTGGGNNKQLNNYDGADLPITQIMYATFWKAASNWKDSFLWEGAWTIEDGKIPTLTSFSSQSGDGGLYLTERDIANATVEIIGSQFTYTGSRIEPTLTIAFNYEELVKGTDYTIEVADGSASDGINVGTVTAKLVGIGNFNGEKIDVTYTIQPKALTADMLTIPDGPFIYAPGVPQIPTPTVMDGGNTLVRDTDYTVMYGDSVFAGTANVRVTGKGNYTGVITKNFTIEKATPEALIWPNASEITYGAALSTSSLTGGSNTGTWAWTVGTTVPTAGTVGYEVIFTPADTTNYDWSGVTLRQNMSITVNKASDLTVSTQPSMNAKEGVARSYELDMDNIALNKADTGTKTYSVAEGTDANSILSNVQVNDGKLTYAISSTAAVGNTATVTIRISTANYEDVTATLTITVTPKDTQTIGFEDSSVTKTYGDAKFAQTATQKSGSGTGQITYASDNAAVATVNVTTGEVNIVGAGSANITATKAADDDWYAATAVYGLTVDKKTITITAHDKTVKAKQSEPEYTYVATGLISGDSLTIEPTVTCPMVDMNVPGTYAIVLGGAEASANYAIQYQNGTLTVSALSAACAVVSVPSPAGLAINGTSIAATVANSVSSQLVGVTVSTDAAWALYSDIACTTEITNKTMTLFVGANTAYIKVTAEDGITAKIYTVTITRSASTGGGGSGGGSGSGGSSSGSDTTTTTPGNSPTQPVTAEAPVMAAASAGDSAIASIPDKVITDAIAKAQAEEKKQGKTANGISVALNVTMPKGSTSLTATLTRNSLNSLVSAGVSGLTLAGSPVDVSFDLKALQEIQKQNGDDINITIAPATGLSKEAKALLGNRPVYSITISHIKDGKNVNVTSLGSGTATLSIPYTPGKNEAVGYLFGVYVDGAGNAQRISGSAYDANSGSLLIPTDHFSVYGVGYTAPSAKFTDISNHWGKEAIDYVVGRGLLSGTSATTFVPNTAMTRGMLVTALGRLAGIDTKLYTTNSFIDVKADSPFRPYIEWAYSKGIVHGIGNNQFAPDRAITREEIAVIFTNYAKASAYKLPVTREASAYADVSSIGSVYKKAAIAMQQAGIMMGGTDNRFNPKSNATRAEVSSMLHRYIKLTIDPATARGWALNDAGQWFYYKDGKPLAGWQTIGGKKYYFYSTGILQTGWVKDGNNWRYYSGNKALTGWWDIGSETSKKRYYFDANAVMISGKWLQIDGKWYYFYADGSLALSTKIDGYEVGENGVRKSK